MTAGPRNLAAMSIDVEDWFHVENLKGAVTRESWDSRDLRVERNVDRILELLDDENVLATFFILGWVVERCPDVMGRIADAGHEIASHGYGHDLVYSLSHDQFREDLRRSKALIEDATGHAVRGYRAPSFSITEWAIDILQEEGFVYDSSGVATTLHDRYGTLEGMEPGRAVTEVRDGFFEVWVSSLPIGRRAVPWGGGGYFRLLPYPVFRWGVARILRDTSYIFYLHPWEIDPDQPRIDAGWKSRFRHYNNLHKCEQRLERLLRDFRFGTMSGVLGSMELECVDLPDLLKLRQAPGNATC